MNLVLLNAKQSLAKAITTYDELCERQLDYSDPSDRHDLRALVARARGSAKTIIFDEFALIHCIASTTIIVGSSQEIDYMKGLLAVRDYPLDMFVFRSPNELPKVVHPNTSIIYYMTTSVLNQCIKQGLPIAETVCRRYKITNQQGKRSRKKY